MAPKGVENEEHSHQQGDDGQDVERGQHGIDVDVLEPGETGDELFALDRQPEPIEPVGHRLEQ